MVAATAIGANESAAKRVERLAVELLALERIATARAALVVVGAAVVWDIVSLRQVGYVYVVHGCVYTLYTVSDLSMGRPRRSDMAGRAKAKERQAGTATLATRGTAGYIIGAYGRKAGDPDDGKFTLTLRKDSSGRWLIVSDMDNGNRPPRG